MFMSKELVGENPKEGDMLEFKIMKVLPNGCNVEPMSESKDESVDNKDMKDMSPEDIRKKLPVADRSDMGY